jgi:hypothetical protein
MDVKVDIEIIGYVTTMTNGESHAEVEMPGDSALMGDVLVELGKRYGEKYNKLVIDREKRIINVVAMREGKIITYETPVTDGTKIKLTVIMDGGCA